MLEIPATQPPTKYIATAIIGLILGFLVGLFFGTGVQAGMSKAGGDFYGFVCVLCRLHPYLAGYSVLILLWAAYGFFGGNWSPVELIRGVDKRLSTSKCQFFMWTIVALFSYASVYAARIGAATIGSPSNSSAPDLPGNLLLAMGFSITSAVAAKGITVTGINNGSLSKEHVDEKDATSGDLVKDDAGAIDLTKVQVLGWTIIAIGAYLANVIRVIHTEKLATLPDIDTALMVLMGLGHGAYLGKKLVLTTSPAITNCKPSEQQVGKEVTLLGSSFGATQGGSKIRIDGVDREALAIAVTSWSDTQVVFTIPRSVSLCGPRAVTVTVDGEDSNSVSLKVLPPEFQSISVQDGNVKLAGTGFGQQSQNDALKMDGTQITNCQTWTDAAITFINPNPQQFLRGRAVRMELFFASDPNTPVASKSISIT